MAESTYTHTPTKQGDTRQERIEAARNLIAGEISEQPGWTPTSIAFVLADASMLADPADRDEPYDQLDNQRNLWAKQCHEAESRAERAEAEVARLSMAKVNQRDAETEAANAVSDLATAEAERDELRATVDRVTTLRDHWAHMAGLAMDADTREWLDAASKSLRAALDPEGGA